MNNNFKQPYIDPDIVLHKDNSLEKAPRQTNQIIDHLSPPPGSKILEIGCGEGLTVATLNLNGFDAYGIEPEDKYIENAQRILEANGIDKDKIKKGLSEELPFQEEEFDYVVSFQVLEHVGDVFKTLQETEKVLKKGGETLQFCPSYHSFREGHFHVPMLPFMNKKMFYYWLKIINLITGKKIKFPYLDHLNFLKPKTLERDIFPKLEKLELEEKAGEILKERMRKNKSIFKKEISKQGKISFGHRIVYFLEKIGLGRGVLFMIIKFRFYPQLVVYGKK
jgi:ubiquinone/menaquinone biosynthesis C-methylase UbiE